MTIRPVLIGAAGIIALQLLAVRAAPVAPSDPPPGWSVSDTIGQQYRLGYDAGERAYFIENIGPIGTVGAEVNEATRGAAQSAHRVPYAKGFMPSDLWAASLLQSVKAAPYSNGTLQFQVEVKTVGFTGYALVELKAVSPDKTWSNDTSMFVPPTSEWQTLTASIDTVPDFPPSDSSQGVVTFGFVVRGEGRVLMRNAKLIKEPFQASAPPAPTKLVEIFGPPESHDKPINMDLHR